MSITVGNDRLSVHFKTFGIDSYDLFLKAKALPESETHFDPETETYRIECPARFAGLLGVQTDHAAVKPLPMLKQLFDDQRAIVKMALDAKRFACWSGCGLGKTLIELEWARQVIHRTGGRVLILTLNEIVGQTIEECERFYGKKLPIVRLRTRQEMRDWCSDGTIRGEDSGGVLAISNYEKMNPESLEEQIVTEMKGLAGIALDESSRLKGGGGKQKWAIIKSCRGIEYKLSLTATPAPNDTIEFASQASFLEKMRTENDIIWTFFSRNPQTTKWEVKRHARKAFFEFMASWSIYVNDPKRYGWRLDQAEIPLPEIITHDIEMTEEQRVKLADYSVDREGRKMLFFDAATNAIQRSKFSQIAKGFVYLKGEASGSFERVRSLKPGYVADLIASESAAGHQVLVWTTFNAESDLIAEQLERIDGKPWFDVLDGSTSEAQRLVILERFRTGQSKVLLSKSSLLGFGMNFQCCSSMIFSGWNDSFESYYQAVRRAYRFGQTQSVRVHLPCVRELENDMLENIFRKQDLHTAAIGMMEDNYIAANRTLRG